MRHFFFFFFLSSSVVYSQTYETTFTAKVVSVIDGNTLEVVDVNGNHLTFLLSEVDCPEIGQSLSEEAKSFTSDLVLKKKVIVQRKGKDWLGNKLAVVKLKKGTILHEELLKAGLAWASKKASNQSTSLQSNAKERSLGIWSAAEPTPPWIFRRQQTMNQSKGR